MSRHEATEQPAEVAAPPREVTELGEGEAEGVRGGAAFDPFLPPERQIKIDFRALSQTELAPTRSGDYLK